MDVAAIDREDVLALDGGREQQPGLPAGGGREVDEQLSGLRGAGDLARDRDDDMSSSRALLWSLCTTRQGRIFDPVRSL